MGSNMPLKGSIRKLQTKQTVIIEDVEEEEFISPPASKNNPSKYQRLPSQSVLNLAEMSRSVGVVKVAKKSSLLNSNIKNIKHHLPKRK